MPHLDPNFLKAGIAPCFMAMMQKARETTQNNFCNWRNSSQYSAEELLLAVGEEDEDNLMTEIGVGSSVWGGFNELALGLRDIGVKIALFRVEHARDNATSAECEFLESFQPEAPRFVALAILGKEHWELGVVSGPGGWNALFPIEHWQGECQKVIDFLVRNNHRKLWVPPTTSGFSSLPPFFKFFLLFLLQWCSG